MGPLSERCLGNYTLMGPTGARIVFHWVLHGHGCICFKLISANPCALALQDHLFVTFQSTKILDKSLFDVNTIKWVNSSKLEIKINVMTTEFRQR